MKNTWLILVLMLALVLATGLGVAVVYQRAEIASLQRQLLVEYAPTQGLVPQNIQKATHVAPGFPQVNAAESKLSPQQKIKNAASDSVYQQLLSTCENWQRWYRQDGKSQSRANRDSACRRSRIYGEKELGIASSRLEQDITPNESVSEQSSRVIMVKKGEDFVPSRAGDEASDAVDGRTALDLQLEDLQRQFKAQQQQSR